jgi:uncharacterized protein DUF6338
MDVIKDFNFWAIIAYLLPGILIVQARSFAALAQPAAIGKDSLVAAVIVTVLYLLVLWFAGIALQSPTSISGLEPYTLLRWFVLLPIGIGFVFGLLERLGVLQRFFLRFGINLPSPIETVWLEVFSQQPVGTYMIVVMKDGRVYNTMVTDDSKFSSNPQGNDLYLGQTFSVDNWTPSNPRRGVYIRGSEIQSIEIIARP